MSEEEAIALFQEMQRQARKDWKRVVGFSLASIGAGILLVVLIYWL